MYLFLLKGVLNLISKSTLITVGINFWAFYEKRFACCKNDIFSDYNTKYSTIKWE